MIALETLEMPRKVRIRYTTDEEIALALHSLADLLRMDFSDMMTEISVEHLRTHGYEPPRPEKPDVDPNKLKAEVERRKRRGK